MSLFIKDAEVDALARQVAALQKITKTEAVRRALLHELEREQMRPSLVEQGVAFMQALRARARPERSGTADKGFIDALYSDC